MEKTGYTPLYPREVPRTTSEDRREVRREKVRQVALRDVTNGVPGPLTRRPLPSHADTDQEFAHCRTRPATLASYHEEKGEIDGLGLLKLIGVDESVWAKCAEDLKKRHGPPHDIKFRFVDGSTEPVGHLPPRIFLPILIKHKLFGPACKLALMHTEHGRREKMLDRLLRAGIEHVSLEADDKEQFHALVKLVASEPMGLRCPLLRLRSSEPKQIALAALLPSEDAFRLMKTMTSLEVQVALEMAITAALQQGNLLAPVQGGQVARLPLDQQLASIVHTMARHPLEAASLFKNMGLLAGKKLGLDSSLPDTGSCNVM